MLIDEQFLTNIKSTDLTTKFVENKNILLIGPFIILALLITVIILAFIYSKKYLKKSQIDYFKEIFYFLFLENVHVD